MPRRQSRVTEKTRPHRRVRCALPAGSRRQCFAWDSAGMSGLRRQKTARDGTPEPKNEKSGSTAGRKEQPLRERADPQLVRRAWPTAGREREQSAFSQRDREQPSVVAGFPRHSAPNKMVETPGATERQVPTPQSSAQAPTVQTVLKSWKLHSRSCRQGHRDPSKDRGEILQLQYTDEKVDTTAESSEDSVNAAGTQ